jgi:hypothetical protein
VRTLVDTALGAGRHEFEWDLRSGERTVARSGVYMVRLTQDGNPVGSTRVTVTR